MDADVRRLKEIDAALKRVNSQAKELRLKKAKATEQLYKAMVKKGVEQYEGYTLKKVQPKVRAKKKPVKQKKADAIELFRTVGIDDPETLYEEFEKTQKINMGDSDEGAGGCTAAEK